MNPISRWSGDVPRAVRRFSAGVRAGAGGVAAGLLVCALGAADAGNMRPLRADGLPARDDFFPIAVWLQNPASAGRYREAGINLYVGLWRGPTAGQLDQLQQAGMPVICAQNAWALENKDHPIIAGWMHDDEPDNAQSLGEGRGYGPPIAPAEILNDYRRMRLADSSRPVLLNLGQGVAWDDYIGRGVRRNHPEDYPEYIQGCDIVSFDIYPVVHTSPKIAGRLEYVPRGVERLVTWSRGEKVVWNCIECTHISNPKAKATPAQVRAEVWMSIIQGTRGLIYFVHQFQPVFREAALLDDAEMLAGVTAINRQIHQLAPVLNSPSLPKAAEIEAKPADVPLRILAKRRVDRLFLFAANFSERPAQGSLRVADLSGPATARVLGEDREVRVEDGRFTDTFEAYGVHLYEVRGR